ncbi:MAG: beta strand repeat-containing protein, partial [Pseudobdellovibrionaceae bacterium]
KAVTAATATNQIMIYNGTSWVNSIVSGDATISSAGTLALDTTGVTAGTYTKVTVDAKGRVTTGANLVSGDITTALGFTPLSASSNLSGDVSGASNSNSVDKLKGKTITAGTATGQIMIYNGTSWDNSVVSGDATMTSAGILSLNTVPIAKGGTAATSFTSNALVVANGTGSALTSLTCGLNQLVSFDASGVAGCYAATAVLGGTNFAQNGNSFSADATLGTNDNFNLNFETNGSSRMTIKTDGYVGIGTTNPQYALTLYGAATSMGYVTPGSAGGNQVALNLQTMSNGSDYVGQATAKGWNIYARGNAWATAAEQNDLGFSFWNGTSWSPTTLLLDSATGNVGIGTTSPGTSLDVSGAITVRPTGTATGNTGQILLRELATNGTNTVTLKAPDVLAADVSFTLPSGDGSSGQILSTNGSGVWKWIDASGGSSGFVDGGNSFGQAADLGTNDGQPLNLQTNGTTRVAISQDGTMSVSNRLTLTGGLLLNQGTGSTDNLIYLRSTSSGAVDASMGFFAAGLGSGSEAHGPYFLARGNSYSASANQRGNIFFSAGQPSSPNAAEGALVFQTNAVERLKIYQDGKIGIGGYTPENFLDIRNPAGESTRIVTGNSGGIAIPLRLDNNGAAATGSATSLLFQGTSTNSQKIEQSSINSVVTNHVHPNFNADLYFSTTLDNTGRERMRILSSGNVGIGTSSPGTSLDVTGAITSRPYGTGAGQAGQILMRELATNGTNTVTLKAPDLLAADVSFTMPSGDGSNGQVLSTNGSGVWKWIDMSAGGSASTDVYSNGGNSFGVNATLGTKDTRPLAFMTNNATRMAISQDGSVGIGTTNPVSFVQIAYPGMISAINNANTYLQIGGNESTSNGHRLIGFGYTTPSNTYSPAYMGYQESSSAGQSKGDLIFGARSTTSDAQPEERMRIMSSGNVGIGTNAPGTSLDVSGAITSRPYGTSTGNTGQILMRELVANGTNTVTLRAADNIASDVTFTIPSADGSSGQALATNASGLLYWITPLTSTTGFVNGGNAFGSNASLGTTDSRPLAFMTNNTTRLAISQDGSVGIGTSSPSVKLDVVGASKFTGNITTSGDVTLGTQATRGTAGDRGQLAISSTYLTTSNISNTISWANGNQQELATFLCDGTKIITFSNLKDGAAYTLYISGAAAHSGVCNFASGGYTFKASGGNVAPTASKDVLFTFTVFNNTVIYNMIDNLQ